MGSVTMSERQPPMLTGYRPPPRRPLKEGDIVKDASGARGVVKKVVVIPGTNGWGTHEDVYVEWMLPSAHVS